MPSFDVDSPGDFPKLPDEIQMCRIEIVNATKQLRDLAVGPRESIRWGVWDVRFRPHPLSDCNRISPIVYVQWKADGPSFSQFLDVLALQIIYGFGLGKYRMKPAVSAL